MSRLAVSRPNPINERFDLDNGYHAPHCVLRVAYTMSRSCGGQVSGGRSFRSAQSPSPSIAVQARRTTAGADTTPASGGP